MVWPFLLLDIAGRDRERSHESFLFLMVRFNFFFEIKFNKIYCVDTSKTHSKPPKNKVKSRKYKGKPNKMMTL